MEQTRLHENSDFHELFQPPKYDRLRHRLVRLFARRGSANPEDLADETIARVLAKVPEIAATYEGDPARYVFGVARNVYLESTRRPTMVPLSDPAPSVELDHDPIFSEAAIASLESCLETLGPSERELVLEYHRHGKRARAAWRRLAERLGITEATLRLRVHRIRQRLYKCVSSRLADL